MAIDTEDRRASAAAAGTWLTRVLRPTGTVDTADRVFIVREYTGLTYSSAEVIGIIEYARASSGTTNQAKMSGVSTGSARSSGTTSSYSR